MKTFCYYFDGKSFILPKAGIFGMMSLLSSLLCRSFSSGGELLFFHDINY